MTNIDGLMGLAMRCRVITLGTEPVLAFIRSGKAQLVLLDSGASEGTKKKLTDACRFRGVPVYMLPEGEIDRACGCSGRLAAAFQAGSLTEQIKIKMTQMTQMKEQEEQRGCESI